MNLATIILVLLRYLYVLCKVLRSLKDEFLLLVWGDERRRSFYGLIWSISSCNRSSCHVKDGVMNIMDSITNKTYCLISGEVLTRDTFMSELLRGLFLCGGISKSRYLSCLISNSSFCLKASPSGGLPSSHLIHITLEGVLSSFLLTQIQSLSPKIACPWSSNLMLSKVSIDSN